MDVNGIIFVIIVAVVLIPAVQLIQIDEELLELDKEITELKEKEKEATK